MRYWNSFVDYIKGSRLEVKQVTWPTRSETVRFTLLVVFVSLLVSVFLGGLDFVFTYFLELFIL